MDIVQRRVLIASSSGDLQAFEQHLKEAGFDVSVEASAAAAHAQIEEKGLPHALVVDLDLPDGSGYSLCQDLYDLAGLPILTLASVHNGTNPANRALEFADDFIRKPFDPSEGVMRIRRILSRITSFAYASGPKIYVNDWLTLDPIQREIQVRGERRKLTPIENALLHVLVKHQGEVVDSDTLIERVWRSDPTVSDRNVLRVHIHRLRQKIEHDSKAPHVITTERGIGYSFVETNSDKSA